MKSGFILSILCSLFALNVAATGLDGGPRATIAGKSGGEISKKELLAATGITVNCANLKSYTVSVVLDEKTVLQKNGTGTKFDDEIRDVLRDVKPGQKVYFERIIGMTEEGREFKMPNMIFTVK